MVWICDALSSGTSSFTATDNSMVLVTPNLNLGRPPKLPNPKHRPSLRLSIPPKQMLGGGNDAFGFRPPAEGIYEDLDAFVPASLGSVMRKRSSKLWGSKIEERTLFPFKFPDLSRTVPASPG